MGYRTITLNESGHQSHLFVLHDFKRQGQYSNKIILSCWCGETVEEVRS